MQRPFYRTASAGLVLIAACAVSACRYDEAVTPADVSAAGDRGTIPFASLLVDACQSQNIVQVETMSPYKTPTVGDRKLDATNDRFMISSPPDDVNQPVQYGGGTGICWSGGEVLGQFPPSTPWGDPYMHKTYGMLPGNVGGGADDTDVE